MRDNERVKVFDYLLKDKILYSLFRYFFGP